MRTITINAARASLNRLIDLVTDSHEPILIAGEHTNAVLVSKVDWKAIQESLFLLSVPGMHGAIKEGMSEPLDTSAKELD
ncbi:MAG: type II toxin-antitoxin system Phd/YefM family antitoxin [Thiobacillus sp.]|uniref:type II toxin-antitoxin system Phd/YefM family antitoxin n=1 Tax=Thiobacillus sp. TaxID=924 RepID=UPI002736738B|nr:type II toxin-antitoxin system Phd/YefM family antitoxin [Thiobacillus sp.]MDP3585039.1 type II toxin-antitoxin system Phd/YefM family antitoxin [Thiobacillus sp.]